MKSNHGQLCQDESIGFADLILGGWQCVRSWRNLVHIRYRLFQLGSSYMAVILVAESYDEDGVEEKIIS